MTITAPAPDAAPLYEGTPVFMLSRATLVEALSTVAPAVSARPAVPVLGGVLLDGGTDGTLTMSAFNYATAVSVHIPDAAKAAGRILLDHAELNKIMKALVKGMGKRETDALMVTITADGGAAPTVELAGSTMPLTAHAVRDYPRLPEVADPVARVDRETFARETARVLRTVGTDETLPMLTGIQVEFIPAGLVLSGTDRYRAAMTHVPAHAEIPWTACTGGHALVPGESLAAAVKTFAAPTVDIGIQPGDIAPWVSLACGDVTITMRCLDGALPDIGSRMPTSAAATITVDRAAMLTQVQRAAAVLAAKSERNQPVALHIVPDAVSVAPRLSEHAETVTTPSLSAEIAGISEPVRLCCNPRFLGEALESVTTATVTLHTQPSTTKPVLITEDPRDLTNALAFRHLLMPVRVND